MKQHEKYVDQIEKYLDSLSTTTNWIIGSLFVIIISNPGSAKTKIKIFDLEIDAQNASLVMFCFIISLNFYILKLSSGILNLYTQLQQDKRAEAVILMQTHQWICNPFCKTNDATNNIIESAGYAFFTMLWWGALIITVSLWPQYYNFSKTIALMLSVILYFVIGIKTAFVYTKLNKLQEFQNSLRKILTWIALSLGIIGFLFAVIIKFLN